MELFLLSFCSSLDDGRLDVDGGRGGCQFVVDEQSAARLHGFVGVVNGVALFVDHPNNGQHQATYDTLMCERAVDEQSQTVFEGADGHEVVEVVIVRREGELTLTEGLDAILGDLYGVDGTGEKLRHGCLGATVGTQGSGIRVEEGLVAVGTVIERGRTVVVDADVSQGLMTLRADELSANHIGMFR